MARRRGGTMQLYLLFLILVIFTLLVSFGQATGDKAGSEGGDKSPSGPRRAK
ncbi:OLC1v1032429C1 [Oldenlandia corymbosa var. corymbosa]|uniref:OLC1v1032429C1 n=1 Tax=Oldenlandia corymbosa var. corymbosa TaxID=529605 RepID=A0AAV1CNP6_OLDCO|nr:OLC1v1032429C1 [Oldenlandia corymbosa var. corymbosa]